MNKAFTAAVASFYIKLLRVLGQKNLIINGVVNDGSKCIVNQAHALKTILKLRLFPNKISVNVR